MLIDIDYYNKYVYIHIRYIIKILIQETVSVEVAILGKMGFRSVENRGVI